MVQKLKHMYQFELEVQVIKKCGPSGIWSSFRSIRLQVFFKIGVIKNFANSAGKQLC